MSTRALYTFKDSSGSAFNVYKHSDGYPSGASQTLADALRFFSWDFPRFEADEFAAAFVAAGKAWHILDIHKPESSQEHKEYRAKYLPGGEYARSRGGGVRLVPCGKPLDVAPGDIAYRYEVSADKRGNITVSAFEIWGNDTLRDKRIFKGAWDAFHEWANKPEESDASAA